MHGLIKVGCSDNDDMINDAKDDRMPSLPCELINHNQWQCHAIAMPLASLTGMKRILSARAALKLNLSHPIYKTIHLVRSTVCVTPVALCSLSNSTLPTCKR